MIDLIDSNERSGQSSGGWRVSKEINLSVIIAMVMTILSSDGVGAWWASSLQADMNDHRRRLTVLEIHDDASKENAAALKADMAGIKATLDLLVAMVKEKANK